MQPHCSAMPWMPGIADFTAIPKMGVCVAKLYHHQRNHQGLRNRLVNPRVSDFEVSGSIKRKKRIGGMLNCYYRAAA
jgi:hypothetical protein